MLVGNVKRLRCLKRIRKLDPLLPVLIATGHSEQARRTNGLAAGLLRKPFMLDELAQTLERILGSADS